VSENLRREEIEVEGAQGTGYTDTAGTGTMREDDRSLTQKAKDALDRDDDGRIG